MEIIFISIINVKYLFGRGKTTTKKKQHKESGSESCQTLDVFLKQSSRFLDRHQHNLTGLVQSLSFSMMRPYSELHQRILPEDNFLLFLMLTQIPLGLTKITTALWTLEILFWQLILLYICCLLGKKNEILVYWSSFRQQPSLKSEQQVLYLANNKVSILAYKEENIL